MTRFTALLLLLCTLTFTGCKKNAGKVAASTPAPAPIAQAGGTPSTGGEAPQPSAPDFAPATAATTSAKTPTKPAIDGNAAVVAFCYHNIEDSAKTRALTISVAQFEKEMQQIKDAGFTVIGMQDFLAWRRGEKNIPGKSCLITIDDGWVSGYTHAWPVLKKFGYPFTMFIYVNYVGTGGKSLTWAQLEEMRDAGVDLQSHTYSHSNLKAPGIGVDKRTADLVRKDIAALGHDGWLRKEIVESKKVLEQQLGIRVNALAYPFGVYNQKARDLVKEAGYEAAFTVYGQRLSRTSPSDLLGRYAIEAAQPKIFADGLAMIGGGGGSAAETLPSAVGQLAATSMVTQPLNNETITSQTPTLKANLSTMGEIEPGSLEVRLSGVGAMTPQFNAETKMLTVPVTQKLQPGGYSVIVAAKIEGQRREVRWNFTVAQTAGALLSATPAPAPTTPSFAEATPSPKATPKKKR